MLLSLKRLCWTSLVCHVCLQLLLIASHLCFSFVPSSTQRMRWTQGDASGPGLDARQPKNDAVLKGIKEAASCIPTGWEPHPKTGPCVVHESMTSRCEAVGRKDTQSVSHVQSLGGGHTLWEEGQVIWSDRRMQDAHWRKVRTLYMSSLGVYTFKVLTKERRKYEKNFQRWPHLSSYYQELKTVTYHVFFCHLIEMKQHRHS